MSEFNKWEHLIFNGEFAERKKILSGLTAEQVNVKPAHGMHSIYEELWHTERCLHIDNDIELDKKGMSDPEEIFPKTPATQEEWDNLVRDFLKGLDKMMKLTSDPERLRGTDREGVSAEDNVYSLIVHNTYHLAKIVSVRQMINAWPPK